MAGVESTLLLLGKCAVKGSGVVATLDSFNTKLKLQRKLKPNEPDCESQSKGENLPHTPISYWLRNLDLGANPLMLLANCVNIPIYCSVFHSLRARVTRCSACVNGALDFSFCGSSFIYGGQTTMFVFYFPKGLIPQMRENRGQRQTENMKQTPDIFF